MVSFWIPLRGNVSLSYFRNCKLPRITLDFSSMENAAPVKGAGAYTSNVPSLMLAFCQLQLHRSAPMHVTSAYMTKIFLTANNPS